MGELMKCCRRCCGKFPANSDYFGKYGNSKDGLHYYCRVCWREYGREMRMKRDLNLRDIAINLLDEEWLPIVGHEGWYEVSNFGRIKRVTPGGSSYVGRLLKPSKHRDGYIKVLLSQDGVERHYQRHCLVARAFIGPRPDGMQINHKNGDKTCNHVDNLEYVTPGENLKHAFRIGLMDERGEKNPGSKLTETDIREIRLLLAAGVLTQKEIGDIYGVVGSNISQINTGKTWAHVKDE